MLTHIVRRWIGGQRFAGGYAPLPAQADLHCPGCAGSMPAPRRSCMPTCWRFHSTPVPSLTPMSPRRCRCAIKPSACYRCRHGRCRWRMQTVWLRAGTAKRTRRRLGDGGFTCDDGAFITGSSFGQVVWENIRRKGTFHIHATVQLRNVAPGTYDIFANQDVLCKLGTIDFKPGSSHKTKVIVDNTRNGDARMRLSFGAGDQGEPLIAAGHAPGVHRLWVTLELNGVVKFRSRAHGVQIKNHKDH